MWIKLTLATATDIDASDIFVNTIGMRYIHRQIHDDGDTSIIGWELSAQEELMGIPVTQSPEEILDMINGH